MTSVATIMNSTCAARPAEWPERSRIRNLFIIPTVGFLIVFNIFPLIYSLGYSFTDFSASATRRRISSVSGIIANC